MDQAKGDASYAMAAPHVTAEEFDGEFVVLNLETGRYFSFSGAAGLVWQGLVAGLSLDTLGASLPKGSPARAAFAAFVTNVIDAALVRESSASAQSAPGNLAERIAAAGDDFIFEVFDDLAALLLADPIHDVEREAGWPRNVSADQ